MRQAKLIAMGCLITLALCALSATMASAQPTAKCEPKLTGTPSLTMICIENKSGELLVLGLPALETIELLAKKVAATESFLRGEASGIEITCSNVTVTALADGTPLASASFIEVIDIFTGCKTNVPGCTLDNEEIRTELLVGNLLTTEDGKIEFTPAAGKIFTTFVILGAECTISKTMNIEGHIEGALLQNGVVETGVDTVVKTLDFEAQLGLKILETEETEFTVFLEVELDRPNTWSSTVFNEHPAWGLFLTTEIS
jgi:hypothetical protein